MKRIFTTFLWWGLTATVLMSQSIPHRAVKCDVSALSQRRMQMALEFFRHRPSGFELQVAYENYRAAKGIPSNGLVQTNQYGIERLDTFYTGTNRLLGTSSWYAYGKDKPLAELPGNMPKSSLECTVLYRISLNKAGSRWGLALKSGIFATFHRYFSVKGQNFRYQQIKNVYYDKTNFPYTYQILQTTELWRQERETLLKTHRQAGIAFQLGLSRQLGRFLVLEAGFDGRLVFGSAPYSDPLPPAILRSMALRPILNLGWTF